MQQHLIDIIKNGEFGHIYTPQTFHQRLKEELLRSHRLHIPFIYIKIPSLQFDILGNEKVSNDHLRAWKIAVLSIFSNLKPYDVKGYLSDDQGFGLILLGFTFEDMQKLRRQILRHLHDADLLDRVRLTPHTPFFLAYYNTSVVESEHQEMVQQMEIFSKNNAGFFTLEPFHYSELKLNHWNRSLIHFVKRSLDLWFALLALILISPVLLFIASIIKISEPHGTLFFSQTRVGMNGVLFKMWKFRSMYMDAELRVADLKANGLNETDGPVFKMKNDPRVTPIGRFIRKYSLDELPQLWNVLKGDMCLVGPRPPLPKEVAEYLPWHKMRLAVRPGLTCIWQVSGRSRIGFEEWMRLDNQYVRNGSITQDIDLIRRTFKVVFKGDGAY